jgi:hypothetical protein
LCEYSVRVPEEVKTAKGEVKVVLSAELRGLGVVRGECPLDVGGK